MSLPVSGCPCCPNVEKPVGYSEEPIATLSEEELTWRDETHVNLTQPSVIKTLDGDMRYDSSFVKDLPTSYGCCSAFRVLSEEGVRVLDQVLGGIEKHAVSSPRIPKVLRGGTFRSKFLNGMGHSAAILKHVSDLAGCELIYHPMKIQQLHLNFKPEEDSNDSAEVKLKKNVDRWHCDTTPFVLIVFCTDPDEYTGGTLQYFNGTREEGAQLLTASAGTGSARLPEDRVLDVGRQTKGFGVFMQVVENLYYYFLFHFVLLLHKKQSNTSAP